MPSVTNYSPTLAIKSFNFTKTPTWVVVSNHNLANGEIIYIQDAIWSGSDPGINNKIYNITVVDANTITLGQWNQTNLNYESVIISTSTYIGGGLISLLQE